MKSLLLLIANPAAHKASSKKVAMASYYLQSKGYEVEVAFTQRRGDAETIARRCLGRRPALVIAAGGDGTFNEVANGLAGSEIPMAILPLGTTNVLAKELNLPGTIQGALEIMLKKNPEPVSLGKITLTGSPHGISRYFILMAGIGYDALAVRGTSERAKRYSGQSAYIVSGLKALLRFRPSLLTFSVNGAIYEGYSGIVCNAAKYGGPFTVTPDAQLKNPSLYICIFKGKRRIDVARYVLGIVTGTHLRFKDVAYLKAERVIITGNAHVQVDGDYLGMTPASVEIVPDALKLVF